MYNYVKILLLFIIPILSGCKNATKQLTTSTNFVDSLTTKNGVEEEILGINLSDSTYEVKEQMIDSSWRILIPQVPKMDVKSLTTSFYKHLEGNFNGHPAIFNLNLGHFSYSGKWLMEGTLYDLKDNLSYDGWYYLTDTVDYLRFYLKGASNPVLKSNFELKGAFKNNEFKGIVLNTITLQNGVFDFHEQNAEGTLALDLGECYFKEPYTESKPTEDQDRDFSIVYANSTAVIKSANKADVYQFLKDSLKVSDDCAKKADKFRQEGKTYLKKTFSEETHVRNKEYSLVLKANVVWNDDYLLVLNDYFWDNTEITAYGMQGLHFKTYNTKNKKRMYWSDIFKIKEFGDERDNMGKIILKYLEWDKDNDDLNANISEGFTSKGFYLSAPGNHGFYITPVFIPYQVVESFLKDDFKNQYWKR